MKRSLRRLVNLMLLAGSSSALPFGVNTYTTVADSTIHNIEVGALSPLIVQKELACLSCAPWRGM